jgi:hypothetical protein
LLVHRALTPNERASSRRPVVFPELIMPDLRDHLDRFVCPDPDALLFVGPRGGRPRRSNFHRLWHKARTQVGLPPGALARPAAHR